MSQPPNDPSKAPTPGPVISDLPKDLTIKPGKYPEGPEPSKGLYMVKEDPDQYGDGPVFIYGGPWIVQRREGCWLEETTPLNLCLSGAFKKSYAYYSLKERTPAMLTKVIDVASKKQYSSFVNFIAKLKHDLVTNKPYEKFTAQDDETEKWNEWIDSQSPKTYFGNNWVFTECYVYRKIQEGIQLNHLGDFDPFEDVKRDQFIGNIEPMCVVAEKLMEFSQPKEDRAIQKNEWVALLKVSLWANRCDLSQSLGEKADLSEVCPQPVLPFPKPTAKPKPLKKVLPFPKPTAKPKPLKKGKLPPVAPPLTDLGYIDPFQITLDLKPNLLIDDSAKSFGPMVKRCTKIRNNIQKQIAKNEKSFKQKCSCHRLARVANVPFQWDPEKPEPNWLEMFPSGKKKKG
ncbi:hypothetical protein O0L34_g10271 [Tuta absoluta]|nr:hypothetical protein O0L34_g10271 [Tuta absoluta]